MGKRRPHKRRASSVDSTATSSSPPSPPLTPDANTPNFETCIRKKVVPPSSDRQLSAYIYKKSPPATAPTGQTKNCSNLFRRKSTGFWANSYVHKSEQQQYKRKLVHLCVCPFFLSPPIVFLSIPMPFLKTKKRESLHCQKRKRKRRNTYTYMKRKWEEGREYNLLTQHDLNWLDQPANLIILTPAISHK